jgi:5-methylcytosine-specific restriction endonuclease McrA
VDHIVNRAAGGTDDETNLWSLCIHHHLVKTSREGNAARHRLREARPPERHPGLL